MNRTCASIRGTCDFNPSQTHSFRKIIQQAREILGVFGYQEIILPLLEEECLFRRGVGEGTDIVERQMFKIEGKDIVLRPEGTAQVIRYYLEKYLYKQANFHKFSYIGAMFRGERPQKGRLRQFHHIGAEAIGSDSFYLDAEVIVLAARILDAVGVEDKELLINSLGCAEDKVKFSKELRKSLDAQKDKLCPDCRRRWQKNTLRVLDCKNKECRAVTAALFLGEDCLCAKCREDFLRLRSLLDDLGVKYTYTPRLVRGLDYYTNTVFEIVSRRLGSQDALGAGGRYNNLVRCLGGPDIAAIGFALGIERIMLVLGEGREEEKIKVFLVTTQDALRGQAGKVLQELRNKGVPADMDYCSRSLKGQLRYAQKRGTRFVVIIGEEELKDNCVMLKDMEKGGQEKVGIEEAVNKLIACS